jgi:hypothetical protein
VHLKREVGNKMTLFRLNEDKQAMAGGRLENQPSAQPPPPPEALGRSPATNGDHCSLTITLPAKEFPELFQEHLYRFVSGSFAAFSESRFGKLPL